MHGGVAKMPESYCTIRGYALDAAQADARVNCNKNVANKAEF
jgi:hypothetical protein